MKNTDHLIKKGQVLNPKGRGKGSVSIKQAIKNYYMVNPEEYNKRVERLAKDPKYDQLWMNYVEGLPVAKTDVTVTAPKPILGGTTTPIDDDTPLIDAIVPSKGKDA